MSVKHRMMWAAALVLLLTLTAALAEDGEVRGTVWVDKTPDGLWDGEPTVKNVTVILEKTEAEGDEKEIARAVTERDGAFALTASEPGDYRLRIELPEEYHFTLHGLDSMALPIQGGVGYTPVFSLEAGEIRNMNIGTTKGRASVTFMVFEDANQNGGRASAEKRLSHVRVGVLYEYEGQTYTVAETTTPVGGRITLTHLSPGTYRAYFEMPEGYRAGPMGTKFSGWYNCFTQEGNLGLTVPFTVGIGDNQWVGAGVVKTAIESQ